MLFCILVAFVISQIMIVHGFLGCADAMYVPVLDVASSEISIRIEKRLQILSQIDRLLYHNAWFYQVQQYKYIALSCYTQFRSSIVFLNFSSGWRVLVFVILRRWLYRRLDRFLSLMNNFCIISFLDIPRASSFWVSHVCCMLSHFSIDSLVVLIFGISRLSNALRRFLIFGRFWRLYLSHEHATMLYINHYHTHVQTKTNQHHHTHNREADENGTNKNWKNSITTHT